MVTVLLVGASLTVVASTATFVAIDEFGASQADRDAAQAVAIAEAGIDRLALKIRSGDDLTWNNIRESGCGTHPTVTITGTIGNGSYTTTLEPYDAGATGDARFIQDACPDPPDGTPEAISPIGIHSFVFTSTGVQPDATRVIRQVVDISPLGLPIGVYTYERVNANGTVNLENISMVSEGDIHNRDKLGFFGSDPYYTLDRFYEDRFDGTDADLKMPAAAHASGTIYYGAAGNSVEHTEGTEPNCNANKAGTDGQSLWDGSRTATLETLALTCSDWKGAAKEYDDNLNPEFSNPPITAPTSMFTDIDRRNVAPNPTLSEQDYLTLRSAAKASGLYCTGTTRVTLTCTEANRDESPANPFPLGASGQLDAEELDDITARSFVVYIDFTNEPGSDPFSLTRTVSWSGGSDIGPCSTDPVQNRSAVIIVRRGSVDFAGGAEINGALLVPEGLVSSTGTFTLEGTLIARRLDLRGTATLRLSTCWLQNLPGPFLDLTGKAWTEVDR